MRYSIIVPVFNVAPYLRECLDSVLAQTHTDWEAICVDDGSTDGSSAILDEYGSRYDRIKVIHQPNSGVGVARNAGIEAASGDYLGFVDADDVIAPSWLSIAAEVLALHPVDLLRFSLTYWEDGKSLPFVADDHSVSFISGRQAVLNWGWPEFLKRGWSTLSLFRRTEVQREVEYRFPEKLPMREDNIFSLANLEWVESVAVCSYAGYYYRQRSGSAITKTHRWIDQWRFRRELRRVWKNMCHELRGLDNYTEIRRLYESNLAQRMCPEWRYGPSHILKAVKRRLGL